MSVAIVQLSLPHYRMPFFGKLAQALDGNLLVVTGPADFGGSPVTVSETTGVGVVKLGNYFIRNQFALQFPLPKEIFSCDVAVIGFNPRILSNLWILIRRKLMKKPVVLWGHGLSPRPSSLQMWTTLRMWMAQLADAVIFYSEGARDTFIRLGVPDGKLFVAHNAIDVTRIQKLAYKGLAECTAKRHVLYVGRLIPAKKVDILVEAFQRALMGLLPETMLIIVGDGPERARLVALVESYGIADRVEFTGAIFDDVALAPLFKKSLLTVSPGYLGLSAIHSLAFGVPVLVADDEPHSPEIEVLVQGRNCEYFEAGSADSLARKLIKMLCHPEKLLEMGRAGLDDVTKRHSVEQMTETFMKAFLMVKRKSVPATR